MTSIDFGFCSGSRLLGMNGELTASLLTMSAEHLRLRWISTRHKARTRRTLN
jgi:hypothetical protein